MTNKDRLDRLELEIDLRIRHLWSWLEGDEWNQEDMAVFMRAAYGAGYSDALIEKSKGETGKLCVEFGYPIPGEKK